MRAVISSVVWWCLIAAPAFAGPNPKLTVAVYTFADLHATGPSGGGDMKHGSEVAALLTAHLSSDFAMVERSALNKALGEQALGESGLVTADTAARVGQLTGARALVTGQVILLRGGRVMLIAKVLGTESGRLFAAKAEGAKERMTDLAGELAGKIAVLLRENSAEFAKQTVSREERLEQVLRNVRGTNRPTVSVDLHFPPAKRGGRGQSATAQAELGRILQKAGFTVVDGDSERRAELMVVGVVNDGEGPRRGELFSFDAVVRARVTDRRTGRILAFAGTTARAVDIAKMAAGRDAISLATVQLAEKLLPILSQQP